MFVWFIVLTSAAGGLAVHILSQDAAEEAASATEAVSTAARAPGASASNVTCTAAADETPCPPCLASLIVVRARNFKNDDGVAKLWVHNDKDEWNADKDDWDDDGGAFFVGEAPIHNKENTNFTVYTTAVPANYGVLVLHDKDANGKMKTNGTAAKCMYCFHETRTCMAGMVSRVDFTLSDGSWGTIDRKLWRRAPSSILELHFHMRDNRVCYTTYLPPPTNRVPPPPSSTGFDMSELSSALSSVTGDCESDTEDLKNFLADSDSGVIYSLYADM